MAETYSFIPGPLLRLGKRFESWLDSLEVEDSGDRGVAARFWGNPRWALFCFLFLLGTLVMPAEGVGVRFCLVHRFTGLDCPGCGMTRGIAHVWRGSLGRSLDLHFFAPLAFLFLCVQSSALFVPRGFRGRVLDWIDRHDLPLRRVWVVLAFAFLAHGALRIAFGLFWGAA